MAYIQCGSAALYLHLGALGKNPSAQNSRECNMPFMGWEEKFT